MKIFENKVKFIKDSCRNKVKRLFLRLIAVKERHGMRSRRLLVFCKPRKQTQLSPRWKQNHHGPYRDRLFSQTDLVVVVTTR